MKKVLFFIPAIVFIVFYGLIIIVDGPSVSPVVFLWIALFIGSGILMVRKLFWGAVLGFLPGFHLMYMSTVDTGQIMNVEFPSGVIIVIYYLLCGIYIFLKFNRHTDKA